MYIAKQLNINHTKDIYLHLISLEDEDKYNRFCGHMTNSAIENYVNHINYQEDGLFGVFNEQLELVGFSHVATSAYQDKTHAEFAFSVLAKEQGKGLGNVLMKKAVLFSKSKGIKEIQMNCLATNQKSQHLAKKHGLKIHLAEYGERTAILETEHHNFEQIMAQNQNMIEENFASLNMIRQINVNYFDFLQTLYANSVQNIFDNNLNAVTKNSIK